MRTEKIPPSTVQLIRAVPGEEAALQNLIQLYTHDFSELWAGTARGDLNSVGRFQDYPLANYWRQSHWMAFFICRSGVLAGFCLVNDQIHSGLSADRSIGEFFILRKHRGQGVGGHAAHQIFAACPGSWEIAVARKNVKAREFWRVTIQRGAAASDFREIDIQNEHWDGTAFQFNWGVLAQA
jgi:predicted acetyltransferase